MFSWLHRQLQPHRPEVNSYDVLKCLALILMILDHAGRFLWPEQEWLRVIGRAAFPLFFFLIGWSGKFGFDKTLFVFAALLALLDGVTGHPVFPLDILSTVLLTRAVMAWLTTRPAWLAQPVMLLLMLLIWYLPAMALVDYGTLGIGFALLGYAYHTRAEGRGWGVFIAALWLWYAAMQWLAFSFSSLQFCVMVMLLAQVARLLLHFRLTTVLPEAHPAALPVKLASRLSLYWYALHFTLFLLLDRAPHIPGQWVWADPELLNLFSAR